jgi:RNA-directed DNA polymerase
MLFIQKVEHMGAQLGTTSQRLLEVADNAASFCEELELADPTRPEKKARDVLNVTGDLRTLQTRLLAFVLAPKYRPSPFSHGGVKGRHIKSNARVHVTSVFGFTTDVANFYPSISYKQIYNLFFREFRCSPDVARVCMQLCTYRYHLAIGLITSPILADCIMRSVDERLAAMCREQGLRYSRFVDDITISGDFPIMSGSFPKVIVDALGDYGLKVNSRKHAEAMRGEGRFDEGKSITKLEIKRGVLRVRPAYIEEVRDQLSDGARLAAGHPLRGHYYTDNQIHGRIHFVKWINSGQAVSLFRRYKAINWRRVEVEASARGYRQTKICLTKKHVPAEPGVAIAMLPAS